jgi:predicted RNase H-like HicB family nuclease
MFDPEDMSACLRYVDNLSSSQQTGNTRMKFTIETDREEDGRWIAEVPELPCMLCYGATQQEAMVKAEELALHVLKERNHSGDAVMSGG